MARKPRRKSAPRPISRSKPERERIIDAFMGLLAEKPFERIGFAEIATAAKKNAPAPFHLRPVVCAVGLI